jgi:copper homeostasis protein (lipoprotein)
MNTRIPLLCVMACILTTAGCTTPASDDVADAAAVPLTGTIWRLTQIGGQLVDNPAGDRAANIQLQSENARVTGFAGCNRMFGGYSLNGEMLKFGQVGATKMACLEEGRMQLESRFFETLSQVARWKITDSTLELLDDGGQTLATFAATPAAAP